MKYFVSLPIEIVGSAIYHRQRGNEIDERETREIKYNEMYHQSINFIRAKIICVKMVVFARHEKLLRYMRWQR